jgi:hypothetical protein
MKDNQSDNQSDYVKKIVSVVEARDEKIYNLENMEHWTSQNIKDFLIDINHEMLREILELENWMTNVLGESDAISVVLSNFSGTGEQVTVRDAIQLSIVKLHTMKKILKVMKKYAEVKHSNENSK